MDDSIENQSVTPSLASDLTTTSDGKPSWKPTAKDATLELTFTRPVGQVTTIRLTPVGQPSDMAKVRFTIKLIDDKGDYVSYPTSETTTSKTTPASGAGKASTTTASGQAPVKTPGEGESPKVRPLAD